MVFPRGSGVCECAVSWGGLACVWMLWNTLTQRRTLERTERVFTVFIPSSWSRCVWVGMVVPMKQSHSQVRISIDTHTTGIDTAQETTDYIQESIPPITLRIPFLLNECCPNKSDRYTAPPRAGSLTTRRWFPLHGTMTLILPPQHSGWWPPQFEVSTYGTQYYTLYGGAPGRLPSAHCLPWQYTYCTSLPDLT